MLDLSPDDERAVERLSFYMLKEAYSATASVLEKLDPVMAKKLFERIERQIEEALQHIHSHKSEGAGSTAIATAIAETLVPILDECHRHEVKLKTPPSAKPSVGIETTKCASAAGVRPPTAPAKAAVA